MKYSVFPPSWSRQFLGHWGELFASAYLEEQGLNIVARNVRTRGGEIDLIGRDPELNGLWIFIEVRTLRTAFFGIAEESLTAPKLRRLHRLSLAFLQRQGCNAAPYRVDAVTLMWPAAAQRPVLHHWTDLGQEPAAGGVCAESGGGRR